MSKATRIVLTIVLLVVVGALIALMLFGLGPMPGILSGAGTSGFSWSGGNWGFSLGSFSNGLLKNGKQGLEFTANAADVNEIILDFAHEDIELVTVEGSTKIHVQQLCDYTLKQEDIMKYGIESGKFIAQSGLLGRATSGWNTPHSTIRVEIPENLDIDVRLDTGSGDVNATGGSYATLRLDTASGNVTAEGVTTNSLRVDTASGNITLKKIKSGSTRVDTASGTVYLSGDAGRELNADSASGNITCDISAGSVDIDTMSGEIEATLATAEKINFDTASGNVQVSIANANDLREIKLNTISGEIDVMLPTVDGFTLDYDSISGDLHNQAFEMLGDTHGNGRIKLDFETVSGNTTLRKVS